MFKYKLLFRLICISLLFVGLYCSTVFSATLIVEDGQLMGATGVLVNDVSYDVEFLDGSADSLYSDGVDFTFTFTTETDALAASAALLDQVFIDDAQGGLFDSDPTLTNGGGYAGYIYVYTPYEIDETVSKWVNMTYAYNSNVEPDSTGSKYDVNTSLDTTDMSGQVYAVWSLSDTGSVPVPTTIALLGSGLLSLTGLRRRKYFNKA